MTILGRLTGRVAGLAMTAAGVAVVPALVTAPAHAEVGTARPVAVAIDVAGTSFLGYPAGNKLAVVSVDGEKRAPVPLASTGAVSGLATDRSAGATRIWVDQNSRVSAVRRDGTVLRTWTIDATCANDAQHAVSRYGGIALSTDQVYVADRCTGVVRTFSKKTGALVATLKLPRGEQARGLVWRRGTAAHPAQLFVAVPDLGSVLTFRAGRLDGAVKPAHTLRLEKPSGGRGRPVPAGVTIDKGGNLAVSDVANNAIYLYSTGRKYSRYRVLGHPGRAYDSDGYLNYPAAFAQHPQDGGGLAGNLFIADTRNGREQRWEVGGGSTYWVRTLAPPRADDGADPSDPSDPSDPGTVSSQSAPSIRSSGDHELLCNPGRWSGGSASFAYRWLRDGVAVAGATGSTYSLTSADDRHQLVCRVTATTSSGSATADSSAYYVGKATRPVNTAAPRIIGKAVVGATLSCATGTWTGAPAPTYAYQWLRNGIPVADVPSYSVPSADLHQRLSCTVTASNQAGAASASSRTVRPVAAGHAPSSPHHHARPCGGSPRIVIGESRHVTYVGSRHVTIKVVLPRGARGFAIANSRSFAKAAYRPRHRGCSYSWTLRSPANDATPLRVYVRFTGGQGDGRVVSDVVRLDRHGPDLRGAHVRFVRRHWVLRVDARDPSGVTRAQFSHVPRGGPTKRLSHGKVRVKSPANARYVRVFDAFGNASRWVRTR